MGRWELDIWSDIANRFQSLGVRRRATAFFWLGLDLLDIMGSRMIGL
jgi:hypothetical protein